MMSSPDTYQGEEKQDQVVLRPRPKRFKGGYSVSAKTIEFHHMLHEEHLKFKLKEILI